jgi:hypothetical protein
VSTTVDAVRITQTGTGNALVVEDAANPDSTPFAVNASGNVGIGTSSPGTTRLYISSNRATDPTLQTWDTFNGATFENSALLSYDGTKTFFYNFQANPLAFGTNNTERLRIDASGNVGIGTSTPTTKLTVGNASGPQIEASDGTVSQRVGYCAFGAALSGSASNHPYLLLTNDTERLRIDTSGNVGIGTSSPGERLVIQGSTTNVIAQIRNSSTVNSTSKTTAIQFIGTDTVGAAKETGDILVAPADNNYVGSNMLFYTRGSDAVAERLRVGELGQIGIGGANYGTAGQVLTSNGSGSAPSWAAATSAKAATTDTFNSSGTWTKPSGYGANARAFIQVWGGGGGGRYSGASPSGSGGGGGGYSERWIALSDLSATETVTIGAGGTAGTASGGAGGNTTFGSILTGYGGGSGSGGGAGAHTGGSGGGQLSAGGNGAAGSVAPNPGQPWINFTTGLCGSQDTPMSRGGGYASAGGHGFWGGGGGGGGGGNPGFAGGKSYYGGGGGGSGASSGAAPAGGIAVIGGNGGTGGVGSGAATAGVQPGGGGGGSYTGSSGAGAAGRVIITVFDGV